MFKQPFCVALKKGGEEGKGGRGKRVDEGEGEGGMRMRNKRQRGKVHEKLHTTITLNKASSHTIIDCPVV